MSEQRVRPPTSEETAETNAKRDRGLARLGVGDGATPAEVAHAADALVDQEQIRESMALGGQAIPFLERGGQYWGPPADDLTAIRELERLRLAGAKLIVFAWPAFWWLDFYSEFARYLYSHFNCILKSDRLIAFSFRP